MKHPWYWDEGYEGASNKYHWHDLMNNQSQLLGYVRHTRGGNDYTAQINDRGAKPEKFDNLEDAKGHIISYYVAQKLEGT